MFITEFLSNNYLYIIAAIPICLATLAYYNQNLLLYCNYLPKNSQGTYTYLPSRYNLPFEDVYLTTRDNVRIHAWFIRYRHAKGYDLMEAYVNTPTIIYFHGNAGNISHRLHTVKDLYKHVKCNILLVSYRGYGQSEGSPSEHGLICDAEAALNFIYERKDINHDKVFVFGRSLGGAVALRLATLHSNKIKGVIVENTFTSVPDMIDVVLPYLKYFKFLSRNKWRNIDRIKELKSNFPIMFVSGMQDELVPPHMMQTLIDNCSSNDKTVVRFEDGTHNNTWMCLGYYRAIAKFIYRENVRPSRPRSRSRRDSLTILPPSSSLSSSPLSSPVRRDRSSSDPFARLVNSNNKSNNGSPVLVDDMNTKEEEMSMLQQRRNRVTARSPISPAAKNPVPRFSDNMDLIMTTKDVDE